MIKNKTIRWVKSISEDVVGYNVYVGKGGVNFDSPKVSLPASADNYVLPGAFTALESQEGSDWYIMVSAVDDQGNTGDNIIGPIELDFFAPAPVTNLIVE